MYGSYPAEATETETLELDLREFVPEDIGQLNNPQIDVPRIARDPRLTAQIEAAVQQIPTSHRLHRGDARELGLLPAETIHLVVTSPPYWTLKKYRDAEGQLGWLGAV